MIQPDRLCYRNINPILLGLFDTDEDKDVDFVVNWTCVSCSLLEHFFSFNATLLWTV